MQLLFCPQLHTYIHTYVAFTLSTLSLNSPPHTLSGVLFFCFVFWCFFFSFFSAVAFGAAKCIEFCEFCFAANTRIQGQMTSAKHFFVCSLARSRCCCCWSVAHVTFCGGELDIRKAFRLALPASVFYSRSVFGFRIFVEAKKREE